VTIRPHTYELHANSGSTHGLYSVLSNPFFAAHNKYKIFICIAVPKLEEAGMKKNRMHAVLNDMHNHKHTRAHVMVHGSRKQT
jgi:hypothetical protein